MATVSPTPVVISSALVEMFVQPIPVRQRIMDRLVERLQRVTIANGYHTDAGLEVVYGQLTEPNPDEFSPSIYIWDSDESAEKVYGDDVITLDVTVSFFELKPDVSIPLEKFGNLMLADNKVAMVKNALGIVDTKIGGLASNLSYLSGTLEPGLARVPWIQIVTQWAVEYVTPIGDPYSIKSQT